MLPAASATLPTPPRTFVIAAAGDILIHRRVAEAAHLGDGAYDFRPMFSSIEPWISSADLAICHLEVTLSPDNRGLAYYPRFVAPHEVAEAIAFAGYDTCSVAGNHALDAGWPGVESTLDLLDAAGVRHDGTARTPLERHPGLYKVNGVTVAHLSFTYGTNGIPVPEEHPYAINIIDTDAILADAAWATNQGAEFVVVSLHWGEEYRVNPTFEQRSLAEALLASPDIDLILGDHVHVVQPIEQIGGKFVVYGMGNHVSNQSGAMGPEYTGTEDGVLVRVTVTERTGGRFGVDRIEVVPTVVRHSDFRILPAADALLTGAAPEWVLNASLARTVSRVWRLDPPETVMLAPTPWPAVSCGGRRATIVGTVGDDTLDGSAGGQVIVGREGDDLITGGGSDVICGGDGDDTLISGGGGSKLFGGTGDDRLVGGSPRDWLIGGDGVNVCQGPAALIEC